MFRISNDMSVRSKHEDIRCEYMYILNMYIYIYIYIYIYMYIHFMCIYSLVAKRSFDAR